MSDFIFWYALVGFAYSLLVAWRCGASTQQLWKDIRDIALVAWFWPWAMLSIERARWRNL